MQRDKYGFLVQKQQDGSLDGGDTVNWTGHEIYLGAKPAYKGAFVDRFEVGWGAWVRHFDPELSNKGFASHYMGPWEGGISRDQLIGDSVCCQYEDEQFGKVHATLNKKRA